MDDKLPDYIMDIVKPQLVAMGYRDNLTRAEYKLLSHAFNYSSGLTTVAFKAKFNGRQSKS